ncbi:hypothetical protein NQZ68_001033 [Dissostichus eleginoides]|nr:hypothetical protein NQZ68_001033 [Dissostichus eleginoides]
MNDQEGPTVKITVKQIVEGTQEQLAEQFQTLLSKFKKHSFNIRQQYAYYRELRKSMATDECLIHVDFSENFTCNTELRKRGLNAGTWNFFEASHGKGAPDGVGAALKRTADMLISHGQDIKDARELFNALLETNTSIKLFFVNSETVEQALERMPSNLTAVPGTMRIHQLDDIPKKRKQKQHHSEQKQQQNLLRKISEKAMPLTDSECELDQTPKSKSELQTHGHLQTKGVKKGELNIKTDPPPFSRAAKSFGSEKAGTSSEVRKPTPTKGSSTTEHQGAGDMQTNAWRSLDAKKQLDPNIVAPIASE